MTPPFTTPHRVEADDPTAERTSIAAPETLETIRDELERGPIIVEHWHCRGAGAPDRLVFDDYEVFCEYLVTKAIAGDAIDVWAWEGLCTPERRIAQGKCPAEDGTVPRAGG